MADATVIDNYPKATAQKSDVQKIQADKIANAAKSCTLTEDDTNWILTTVWPG